MAMKFLAALAVGVSALLMSQAQGRAQDAGARTIERAAEMVPTSSRKHNARRKAARVYGSIARRRVGGYSYDYTDVINTYGLTRSLYGGTNVWRDPMLDRQSRSGPFDNDFFFDSGSGLRGGNSPALH